MCSSDPDRVDAGDGVQEVVSLIHNDNAACQPNSHCLARGGMEESVVRQHDQLGGGGSGKGWWGKIWRGKRMGEEEEMIWGGGGREEEV